MSTAWSASLSFVSVDPFRTALPRFVASLASFEAVSSTTGSFRAYADLLILQYSRDRRSCFPVVFKLTAEKVRLSPSCRFKLSRPPLSTVSPVKPQEIYDACEVIRAQVRNNPTALK